MKHIDRIETDSDKVLSLAYGIVRMHEENLSLKSEVERLREVEADFNRFLNQTMENNQRLWVSTLSTLVNVPDQEDSGG